MLVLNCGSSTVKLALYDSKLQRLAKIVVEAPGAAGIQQALDQIRPNFTSHGITAVGHRVVHGGASFSGPIRLTPELRGALAALTALAPEHQPHNIAGIDALSAAFPDVPHIACFDTSFHRTIPEHRQKMALPLHYADQGLLRYGFHGLSYQHVAAQIKVPRLIACHLGNGCSIAAIADGKSVYTSMGFTPLDGLMMGTRSGSLDPGAVLWLAEKLGIAGAKKLLNKESGLQGVSGLSSDMRTLLAATTAASQLAITMFVDHIVLEIGRAAAALQGADAIAFTGGIGENAEPIRAAIAQRLAWLGHPPIKVVRADEEQVIAEATSTMLSAGPQRP